MISLLWNFGRFNQSLMHSKKHQTWLLQQTILVFYYSYMLNTKTNLSICLTRFANFRRSIARNVLVCSFVAFFSYFNMNFQCRHQLTYHPYRLKSTTTAMCTKIKQLAILILSFSVSHPFVCILLWFYPKIQHIRVSEVLHSFRYRQCKAKRQTFLRQYYEPKEIWN